MLMASFAKCSFWSLITVEPTMFLSMLGIMFTTVVEQAFFIDKACRVNHHFNSTICDNISSPKFKEFNKEVQLTASSVYLMKDIVSSSVQSVMALFMGAWSDKRGRKWPILIGLFGKFYYSTMLMVIALKDDWPVEYIVYFGNTFSALTGLDVAILAAAFTYLVDITTPENRTLRITILDVFFFLAFPVGIGLGAVVFRLVHRSFAIMYAIYAGLIFLAFMYSLLRLEWRTDEKQKPLSEADNIFTDFFDYNHLVNTAKMVFKKRKRNRRLYLWMMMIMMTLFTFQRNENMTLYMYLQLVFHWTFQQVSYFRTYTSSIQVVVLLLVVPLMNKALKLRDTVIIAVGALGFLIGNTLFSLANLEWLIYVGGAFVTVGPICQPGIKSIVSKMVHRSEKGKAYTVLSIAENATPLVATTSYNTLYNATINTYPEAIFYLTVLTQFLVLAIVVFIHFKSNDSDLVEKDEISMKSHNSTDYPVIKETKT